MSRRRSARGGLTIVEVAVIVCVAGIVLAAGIPAFTRAFRASKVSEASESLAALSRGAEAYWARRFSVSGSRRAKCLPAGAGPAPATPTTEAVDVRFADPATPGHETWQALHFQPDGPTRFSYEIAPATAGCDVSPDDQPLYRVRAYGDLDGDGDLSTFERRARVVDGHPTGADALWVQDGIE